MIVQNSSTSSPLFPYCSRLYKTTYTQEKVDVAIIEVGLGGTYDCTNVIEHPTLTAVTHLGFDHCSILGK